MHALSFLIEVMEKLNSDPGKYESYQKELTTLYIEFSENQHVISNAIELIFTQVNTVYWTITLINRSHFPFVYQ